MSNALRLSLLALLTSAGCTAKKPPNDAIVLEYDDFGPQAAAHELIGMQWFQWNGHGSSNPQELDPIHVVVFRPDRISLAELRARFPVIESEQQDYRYVAYEDALAYVDDILEHADAEIPSLATKLRASRDRIHSALD